MIKVVLQNKKPVDVVLHPKQGIQIEETKKYLFDPAVVQKYVDASAENAEIAIEKAAEAQQTFSDITVFVDNSKQELNQIVADGEVAIDGYVDAAEQEIKQIAQQAAEDAIQGAADEATRIAINQTTELVNNEIEPRLQEYASNAEADATNAAESAGLAAQSASDADHYAEDARIWAEGEQAEVEEIGGELSSRGFADFAMAIANTPEDVPLDQSKLIALNIIKGPKGDKGDKGDRGDDGIKGELNNPFSLLDYKWSEYKIDNTSWLLADGAFQDGTVYKSVYELLQNIKSGSEIKEGVSVKLSSESFADTDFVINIESQTFRLPTKVANIPTDGILKSILPVKGNGNGLVLSNGSVQYGIQNDCDYSASAWGKSSTNIGGKIGSSANRDQTLSATIFGVTPNSSKSGIIADLSEMNVAESILKLYFYVGETIVGANIIDYTRQLNEVVDDGIDRLTQTSDDEVSKITQASSAELAEIAQAGDTELAEITQAGEDGAELVRNTVEAILTGDKVLDGSLLIQTPPADDNSQRAVNSEWVNNALKDVGPSGGGLELGDIGIAISIDESKNKRRYLNGQTILQEQFVGFTSWVKERAELFPNIVTTEENWQAEVTNSKLGQCGKFVIDDTLGTIRLPKVVNINGLTELSLIGSIKAESLPNIKGETSSNRKEGSNSGPFYTSETTHEWYGDNIHTDVNDLGFDASLSSSTYQDNAPVQQEAIQYPYFIQVATGVEESVDVTREIELNNPFSLLDYKWSEYELNNASWLLSNGAFHSGTVYKSVYELLLKIYNGTETKDGVSVKLSTEAYEDTDFVINTADTTFRLPIKVKLASGSAVVGNGMTLGLTNGTQNGGLDGQYNNHNGNGILMSHTSIYGDNVSTSLTVTGGMQGTLGVTTDPEKSGIETSSSGLKLYFYVGETIQDANIINAGKALEIITTLANADYVVESYCNGTEWYRVYKSGWIEQGGQYYTEGGTPKSGTIKFLKQFADIDYYIQPGQCVNAGDYSPGYMITVYAKSMTETSFSYQTDSQNGSGGAAYWRWEAKGKGAK